jgi:hypothetical protein
VPISRALSLRADLHDESFESHKFAQKSATNSLSSAPSNFLKAVEALYMRCCMVSNEIEPPGAVLSDVTNVYGGTHGQRESREHYWIGVVTEENVKTNSLVMLSWQPCHACTN